jgi:hypothetical protein
VPELFGGLLSWIAHGGGSLCRSGHGGRGGPVFGAEPGDELSYFVVGERVAEAGHLLTAILDLSGDLLCLHCLADIGQGWAFWGSLGGASVAVGTALVAKEVGSGLLVWFGSERIRSVGEKGEGAGSGKCRQQPRKAQFKYSHRDYFLIDFRDTAPALGGSKRPCDGWWLRKREKVSSYLLKTAVNLVKGFSQDC